MARIPELPLPESPLTGDELAPVVKDGQVVQASLAEMSALAPKATPGEVAIGIDNLKTVTPASLAGLLARIALIEATIGIETYHARLAFNDPRNSQNLPLIGF